MLEKKHFDKETCLKLPRFHYGLRWQAHLGQRPASPVARLEILECLKCILMMPRPFAAGAWTSPSWRAPSCSRATRNDALATCSQLVFAEAAM